MIPEFIQANVERLPFADDTFDLVFGSPPYLNARTYGIGAQRDCQEWVDWMQVVTSESVRVSKGLVIWICAGVTRDWCYRPGPEGLLYEWWKNGGRCWRPAYWHRVGIPGSGGKQWLRADVEYALCFTKCKGAVPFADNTVNGHPPKYKPGGRMSHRLKDDSRKKSRIHRGKDKEGNPIGSDSYTPPDLANPGNLVKGIKVGGGLMGHPLAHKNEAPFPEKLAEWFLRGLCPRGGRVLDPFSGSGTTVAAATKLGIRGVGCDLRLSQCELGQRRCKDIQVEMF